MRQNSRLIFTRKSSRPNLSVEKANYWKAILQRVLKIGLEFEFNLSGNTGTCDGKRKVCPCANPKKKTTKCNTICALYKTCKHRQLQECPGIFCVYFTSPCMACKDAIRDCSKCNFYKDIKKDPGRVRKDMKDLLEPTEDVSNPGKNGVLHITTDGSLENNDGIEIPTVGRRVDYHALYNQSKKIMDLCVERGAYVNARTSVHMHLLAGYYNITSDAGKIKTHYKKESAPANTQYCINELEVELPEVVLANFHQLVRRYHNALTWISSSGSKKTSLTRWGKFRKPIIPYCALKKPINEVIYEMVNTDTNNTPRGKYYFVNYFRTVLDPQGNVSKLHIEGRFCDGMLSPSAVAAISVLFYCLLVKAASLSAYGILDSETAEESRQTNEIMKTLMNNSNIGFGNNRESDTSNFEIYQDKVIIQTKEMLTLLEEELKKHGPTIQILRKLAEKPCSIRLCEGQTWEDIEKDLSKENSKTNKATLRILEAIDTHLVDECTDIKEWSEAVSEPLGIKPLIIEKGLERLVNKNIVQWNQHLGAPVRC